MPPKKQQQEPSSAIVVWNILPIICNAPQALEYLKKSVNIKKAIDQAKLIQLLKDKGIEKYIIQGKINEEGLNFINQNLNQVSQQYLAQMRKPTDPKKQQKKDTKKDNKKEEVPVQQAQKTIEFNFEKNITEFLIFCDTPSTINGMQVALKSGWKVDVIVLIQQQVKQSSRLPNYDLLNKQRSIDDFLSEVNGTKGSQKLNHNSGSLAQEKRRCKQFVNDIKFMRMERSELENVIIIEVPFQKDLQHPEKDGHQFLVSLFTRLCALTLKRTQYEKWRDQQKPTCMVPTIKQKVKRQVAVEDKKQDKKGSKKQPTQPQMQIIEQIIEKRYEDLPQNIKSDLSIYKRLSAKRRSKGQNIYKQIVQNLILSVSTQTQRQSEVEEVDLNKITEEMRNIQDKRPLNKIGVKNIIDLPRIFSSQYNSLLSFKSKFHFSPLQVNIPLISLLRQRPFDKSFQFQYKMHQFTSMMGQQETRIAFQFESRKYQEKLSAEQLNSRINLELQFGPRIYSVQCKEDNYNLVVLARVNPPGRVLYDNYLFDWKVIPNFEFWNKFFQNQTDQQRLFYDYSWKKSGNLKILNKRMMPSDNMIIVQSAFTFGDQEQRLITLAKENINYGLKKVDKLKYLFWKHYVDLQTYVFSQEKQQRSNISICLRSYQFTVIFDPNPTIFWAHNSIQSMRKFGQDGSLTRFLHNGTIQIWYPNGDASTYAFGKWDHIKSNDKISSSGEKKALRIVNRTDCDKKISVRQDETVFVDYFNGDRMIIFKDETIMRHTAKDKKIQILNLHDVVIRILIPRTKDFNIIGSGSAFAYLGEKDILQRTQAGGLYEFHHPSFTWHSYTENIDKDGEPVKQLVRLLTYRDGSIIKVTQSGLLTFLHKNQSSHQQVLHQRWLQLFTNPQYHVEGVYDVDLHRGSIVTKDSESNVFQISIDGNSEIKIAVSFSISNQKEQLNNFGNGFHVPEQNFFLPHPQNSVIPRLFLIKQDGSGQQFLTEQQLQQLQSYNLLKIVQQDRIIYQYSRSKVDPSNYIVNRFTENVNISNFDKPNLLSQSPKRINLVPTKFNDILFRNIQEFNWSKQFANVKEVSHIIRENRNLYERELQILRKQVS